MKTDIHWEELLKSITNRDWSGAIKKINEIIETDRGNPNLYLKKGDICLKAGDKGEAVNAYMRAAWYLNKDGFLKKALAVYKLVLRYDPDNDDALHESNKIMMELESISESHKKAEWTVFAPDQTPQEIKAPLTNDPQAKAPLPDRTAMPATGTETPAPPGFFSYFTAEEIEEILGRAVKKKFSDGKAVVSEGESGDSVYMIKNGAAYVVGHFFGTIMLLDTLSPGDLFGEMAFLTGRTRTASVIAKGELEVYEIQRPLLEELAAKRPQILSQLTAIYIKRVKDALTKVKSRK